jgi:hypothetical protein
MLVSPKINYQRNSPVTLYREIPEGKSLIVAGTSEKGTLYNPIRIHNEDNVIDNFGSGPLLDRYHELIYYFQNMDVYMMRIEANSYSPIYRVLSSFDCDYLYIDQFNFGNSKQNLVDFVDFALDQEARGRWVHLFSEIMPIETDGDLEQVKACIAGLTLYYNNTLHEFGRFFSAVYDQFSNAKAGIVYAGILLSLDNEISPINKTIDHVYLSKEFTRKQLFDLDHSGIVCFRNSLKRGIVCAAAPCACNTPGSAYGHITNFRIMQYLINMVQNSFNKYIGKLNLLMYENDMNSLLDQILDQMKNDEMIRDYDFRIDLDEASMYTVANLNILAVPIFTTKTIRASVQLRIFK